MTGLTAPWWVILGLAWLSAALLVIAVVHSLAHRRRETPPLPPLPVRRRPEPWPAVDCHPECRHAAQVFAAQTNPRIDAQVDAQVETAELEHCLHLPAAVKYRTGASS